MKKQKEMAFDDNKDKKQSFAQLNYTKNEDSFDASFDTDRNSKKVKKDYDINVQL